MSLSSSAFALRQALPPADKLVLLWLADNAEQWLGLDVKVIAAFAGITNEEALQCIERLERQGYIRCSRGEVRLTIEDEGRHDLIPVRLVVTPLPEYVYFVKCETTGMIKIGTSMNPRARFKALQTSTPTVLRLLRIVRGGRDYEAELHERFAHLRKNGEWFVATTELHKHIEQLEVVDL